MLKGLQENFKKGIEKIKWMSAIFAARVKIELAVIKLLYQSEEKNKKRDELLKTIGRRVIELGENQAKSIIKDKVIAEAIAETEKIEKDIEELKQKASEISSVAN